MNRIVFPGNPWPGGHAIAELTWTGRLDAAGRLRFDLHLVSDDYDAEDDADGLEDEEDEEDWGSKIVWGNYHRATISSTMWGHAGFPASTTGELTADHFAPDLRDEPDWEELACGAYLLGHDSVAYHRIRLTPRPGGGHTLDWRGRIALRYTSATAAYDHEFHATATGVTLSRITAAPELADPVRALRDALPASAGGYTLVDGVFEATPRRGPEPQAG